MDGWTELLADLPSGGTFLVLFVLAGLGPIAVMTLTAFLKVAIVLKVVRNALGLQDLPPNMAINALAFVLTLYIMAPVGYQIGEIMGRPGVNLAKLTQPAGVAALTDAVEPIRDFLDKHAAAEQKTFFLHAAEKSWANERAIELKSTDFLILVPAFITTELTSAFQIAFLIFLPFVAIDMIVSNVLLALGMMMLSPVTVSMPIKLLLFVLVDGWGRLLHGLVLGYQ